MLTIKDNKMLLDDQEIRIKSGAIHYFRVLKSNYKDRLLKLKACGFNTVETYVAWNIHEPKKGEFVFEGHFDLEAFIQTAAEVGLYVIVRPGPYICAEWEFGGFPAWLLKDKNIELRCYDEPYLKHVDEWFDELIPRIAPYQYSNGGPVIAVQIENEYGSYGDDKRYLEHLKQGLIQRGINELLFTSDGPLDFMLTGGTLPDVFKTANFGGHVDKSFTKLEERQPNAPLMCMEFWNGWFDHWTNEHHTRDAKELGRTFEDILKWNGHFNFYMFHGGTNFGFLNGANCDKEHNATTTSYDYHALVSECGDITLNYLKVRSIMEEYFGKIDMEIPANCTKKAYGKVQLTEQAKLFDNLNNLTTPIESATPGNMEKYDQDYGYILYRKQIEGPREKLKLKITEVHDRAQIFENGKEIGIYTRNNQEQNLELTIPGEGTQLDVLVENLGRTNYGPNLKDYKGVTKGIFLGNTFTFGYEIYPLDMKDLAGLQFSEVSEELDVPSFYRGHFEVDEMHDTFLRFDHLTKGFVMINGFNIGRHWEVGPQKTLYIPAGLLKKGTNEIIIFEQHKVDELSIELVDVPILG